MFALSGHAEEMPDDPQPERDTHTRSNSRPENAVGGKVHVAVQLHRHEQGIDRCRHGRREDEQLRRPPFGVPQIKRRNAQLVEREQQYPHL